jgi:hypothetical protein
MTIPARPDAEKITRSGKLWLWLRKQARAAWAAWIAYRASFVFGEDLHGWPVVRHVAPGVLLMKAPYTGPRRVQNWSGWKPPVLTGAAVGVLYFFAYGPAASSGALRGEALLQNSVFGGVFFALISIPLWRLARKTRLVIRFDHGLMSWTGPDKEKRVVKPEEPRSLQVLVPHRWADEERRKHNNWMNSHPRQPAPKPLFQTSSELIVHTGPGGRNWLTVAEFCNDGSGELAHRLQTAIEFVSEKAKEELTARAQEAASSGPL